MRALILTDARLRAHQFTAAASTLDRSDIFFGTTGNLSVNPALYAKLPRYKGELLMTCHGTGCYTSQCAMKRWNRKGECLADAAEQQRDRVERPSDGVPALEHEHERRGAAAHQPRP